jgi:hypothetical protein
MESTDLKLLRDLLTGEKLVTLAVVIEGAPVAGVLPFLAEPGLATLLVHTSKLARHSRGLTPGAPFSAAIHLPLAPGLDALQSQRVVLEGHVEAVQLGEREAVTSAWVKAFPSAAMTVGLSDFTFHRLRLEGGRLISGFARAFGLSPQSFAEAAAREN